MKFDLSKIEFSRPDIKRGIKLPKKLTLELAELIGIIFGDGHLDNTKIGGKTIHRKVVISGNSEEDIDYFKHVNLLFKNLFGIELKLGVQRKKELYAGRDSKAIFSLFKYLEVPVGNKGLIKIPSYLIKSDKLILAFIRGLFDTDGSITFKKKHKQFHYYPVIKLSSKSHHIINQLSCILNQYNLKNCACYKRQHITKRVITYTNDIDISGKKNLKKWMDLIGFNNSKHLTKYQIWKKFGFCPPYTTIKQRKVILKKNKPPIKFYR